MYIIKSYKNFHSSVYNFFSRLPLAALSTECQLLANYRREYFSGWNATSGGGPTQFMNKNEETVLIVAIICAAHKGDIIAFIELTFRCLNIKNWKYLTIMER